MSESMEKQVESWLTSLKTYSSQDTGNDVDCTD